MEFQIEHVGLPARDPVALKDWYGRVFGAELVHDDRQLPPSFLIRMPGGVLIEIYPATSSRPETTNNKLSGWRHLALRVQSIDTARQTLEKHGIRLEAPIGSAVGGGRVLYFADLEGNLLHLVERATPFESTSQYP
jgi:glyoxylase I family protein